jgi:hypothetical protein
MNMSPYKRHYLEFDTVNDEIGDGCAADGGSS